MTIKKYIVRTVVKVIIFMIISAIALSLLQSPVITNEIAMGQMENSNETFMIMDAYNKVAPIISIIYGCITVGFAVMIIDDTYKFIKTKTKEKMKNEEV